MSGRNNYNYLQPVIDKLSREEKTVLVCDFSIDLLHYHFTDIRKTLFHELQLLDKKSINQSHNQSHNEIAELFLYGSSKFKLQQNCSILRSSIKFIIKSERFSGSIVQ